MGSADDRSGLRLPFAVSAVAAGIFSWLVAPSFGLRDAGELGAAGQLLGVAHPTGFAVDLLLLRLAGLVPLGPLAFRQNMLVALVSAATLGALAHLTEGLARRAGLGPRGAATGAVLAAVGLGAWATFFGTALSVEVYSTALLAMLLGALALHASPRPLPTLSLLLGFAVGLHISAGLALSVLALAALRGTPRGRQGKVLMSALLPLAMGASLVAYLPLASFGDPPADWGDPETPGRLWEHLSAHRIRTAFSDRMLASSAAEAGAFLGHLGELAALAVPAALGLVALARRVPQAALLVAALFTLDVAYATYVNPMGIADRQVGHLAGAVICLLAGLGVAHALDAFRGRASSVGVALVAVLAAASTLRAPAPPSLEGYAADELFGAGGRLVELPPRAVLVCATDDDCAGAMFALYAEEARPDVSLAISMHLWEPTTRAGLARDFEALAGVGDERPMTGAARADLSSALLAALAVSDPPRPVFFARAFDGAALSVVAPLHIAVGLEEPPDPGAALRQLEDRYAARFGEEAPRLPPVAVAWSQSYDLLGRGALAADRRDVALRAFRRAVEVAPNRAVAWTNLGVSLAAVGAFSDAAEACRRGVELDPSRASAWLAYARSLAAAGDPLGAREVLRQAVAYGVEDPRLTALSGALEGNAS